MAENNRRFKTPSNPWLPYVGDCNATDRYLNANQGIVWLVPKFVNALLRGVSQVIFANNPMSGLLILLALFYANVNVGLGAAVASTTAIITALVLQQSPSAISAGLTTYNAVLVGCVTTSLWTPFYGEPLGTKMWIFIVLGSALSVFLLTAYANILSSLKTPLPALVFPFITVIVLFFVCLMPATGRVNVVTIEDNQNLTGLGGLPALSASTDLDWGGVFTGILLSSGHVYGVQSMGASIIIYIGVLIYSPILFVMGVLGATVGTFFGIVFEEAPYEAIYSGVYGYNALLAASSVGGFFIVLTCHNFLNAMTNAVFTVIVQKFMMIALKPAHLPIFTIPFLLSTLLFLSVTTSGDHLPRVPNHTYPEMHLYIYKANKQNNGVSDQFEGKELTQIKVSDQKDEETTLAQFETNGSK